MQPSIGVAIITHAAVKLLPKSMPPLLQSPLKARVLVVNSSSNDGTVELAREMGAETLVNPRREFNHGSTREAARKYLGTDIVVMITPDAIASGPEMIGNLVRPLLEDNMIALSYARQLPHDGADFFESFPRAFNYPDKSEVRSLTDVAKLGPRTFFCSDSCAAWSNRALDAIGGFETTLTAEDTIAAARLIYAGYKVAYTADAVVRHSHRYSLKQEFKRYFDTGLMRRQYEDLLFRYARDEERGASFFLAMVSELIGSRPHLLPYAFAQATAKFAGYKVGYHAQRAPLALKRLLSSQDFYWTSTAVVRDS
ncbi:MAG TPA: glycosyltransferase [Rhizomicrobium sp.]|jgi:rhamnosyltransferase|nr:glycosyltransferase [Rhizomicrobium sp.]